ncbi:bifunctional 2-C-methyl-D-erythritol 4-phosphate cytidylyltransferase/2-C-methyl-D-erythritol 2,4-cyclodiphosphate synthase [Rhodobacteraceae bacterium 2CG4]|uniref:Bifunctional enzyme IspD/IspF n=1 Tax=Halovulum marinum TaxID=2662447 RepID=A0A6L5Z4B9_9RHOB|nr:bifunctional 2-C-methyl-D-erythritol 4-phosphate cytidylyltransferase/2-C-methyl-D-erythritol 2,4-cyclodiphosphate synthase [Halovulum marinum]MSU91421.1 bifunctional 2-C-methyl-D-erythritol 4-phosphate cytidylyltransferase/2-C-methyl-D-erythritol 2,4-cyclodiphosphate synthase [Halovulum marinum]
MHFAALIVAAGRGARAGGQIPKQYRTLAGRPVLARTVAALAAHPGCTAVQVVIYPGDAALYRAAARELPKLLPPVPGGATRRASVLAGLEALEPHAPDRVLIHDAARPFVTAAVIDRVLAALAPDRAAFPALPIVDALWRASDGIVAAPQPRADLWRAQTPQGFPFAPILAAHRAADGDADDDVAIARAAGLPVAVVPGDGNNFKITLPGDFDRAERLLQQEARSAAMDVRTGNGYDVHAFGPGDAVTLCGVAIPHERGLKGHSDADVGLHAITDAIFGALAEGDIGQWFPPSDPRWKGADSRRFLARAVERIAARGFRLTHVDCTLICERPKIGPHAAAMRAQVARICGIDADRVSVKATTSERLGFTGRGEGIAAQATATLVSA